MAEYFALAVAQDIPPGTARAFELQGKRIAVCNIGGVFYAVDDRCTHDNAPLGQGALDGDVIECPRHGARFEVTTGRALCLPAVRPIATYPVRIEQDVIQVEL